MEDDLVKLPKSYFEKLESCSYVLQRLILLGVITKEQCKEQSDRYDELITNREIINE